MIPEYRIQQVPSTQDSPELRDHEDEEEVTRYIIERRFINLNSMEATSWESVTPPLFEPLPWLAFVRVSLDGHMSAPQVPPVASASAPPPSTYIEPPWPPEPDVMPSPEQQAEGGSPPTMTVPEVFNFITNLRALWVKRMRELAADLGGREAEGIYTAVRALNTYSVRDDINATSQLSGGPEYREGSDPPLAKTT